MTQKIKIKLADQSDLQAMIQVGDELFDNEVKPDRAEEFLDDPRHHLVLAYHGSQLVGMASGFHYVHPDKDPELFIAEAGVVDEFQNQGIGRQLIRALCAHGKTLGCDDAWVATEQSNTGARKAYSAAGGTEDPEPMVLIELDLNS